MITYHNGDLLESGCDIICNQVNLQGVMGGGLALQIATKYPNCEEQYKDMVKRFDMRGDVHFFCYGDKGYNKYIANCFSQELNFDTNYEWVKSCLKKILGFAKLQNIETIGVPFKYGAGIANGDWNKIENIFKEIFENENNIDFQIWKL